MNVTKSSVKSVPFSHVTIRKGAPVRTFLSGCSLHEGWYYTWLSLPVYVLPHLLTWSGLWQPVFLWSFICFGALQATRSRYSYDPFLKGLYMAHCTGPCHGMIACGVVYRSPSHIVVPPTSDCTIFILDATVLCLLSQLQVREASGNEQVGSRTSSSSVDLLKAFSQQGRRGGGLSAAMDTLGEYVQYDLVLTTHNPLSRCHFCSRGRHDAV